MTPANSPGLPLAEATSRHTRPRPRPPPLLSHSLPAPPAPSTQTPAPPALPTTPRAPNARFHPATVRRETSSCPIACRRNAPGNPPTPAPSANRIPTLLSAHPPAPD